MSEQLSLAGFEPPARSTDRLFFALLPDAGSVARIAALQRQLRAEEALKGAPIAPERLHVTLYFLGDFPGLPQSIVASASRAAESIVFPSFDVLFDHALSFRGGWHGRPCVLRGTDGLNTMTEFQRTLTVAMSKKGLKPADKSGFTPHVTLLYDERAIAERSIESIGWTVREFVLIRSAIGQGRYESLARWQLT